MKRVWVSITAAVFAIAIMLYGINLVGKLVHLPTPEEGWVPFMREWRKEAGVAFSKQNEEREAQGRARSIEHAAIVELIRERCPLPMPTIHWRRGR